jgi:hypothetical protein
MPAIAPTLERLGLSLVLCPQDALLRGADVQHEGVSGVRGRNAEEVLGGLPRPTCRRGRPPRRPYLVLVWCNYSEDTEIVGSHKLRTVVPTCGNQAPNFRQNRRQGANLMAHLEPSDINGFRAELGGAVLTSDDADFETARHVWNGAIDRHPRSSHGAPAPLTLPRRSSSVGGTVCDCPCAVAATTTAATPSAMTA